MTQETELTIVERPPIMSLAEAQARRDALSAFVAEKVLVKDIDYGKVPGIEKNILFKPGAEKLATFFHLTPKFVVLDKLLDFESGLFYFQYACELSTRDGMLVGTGNGSCNSHESKYRWRTAQRLCPECGVAAVIRGKEEYGGGWLCWRKRGGCGAKFSVDDERVTSQPTGRVENPDPADQLNTIDKMAQKRCLASNTPVIVLTSRGVSRADLDMLWELWQNGNETLRLPGSNNEWRIVTNMCREEQRAVYRIVLSDGSYIRATAEHRFPTERGLLQTNGLELGDRLYRSSIPMLGAVHESALPKIGYVVGLFIADGNLDGDRVRYTLHKDEENELEEIRIIAQMLGCTVNVYPKTEHCVAIGVRGAPFRSLVKHFVAGNLSYGKHLSAPAWRQSNEFLKALLEGYLAGDGCLTRRQGRNPEWRIGFTGQNYELARDLRAICAVLGYRLSLKRADARFKNVEYPTFAGWIKLPIDTCNQKSLTEVVEIHTEKKPAVVYDIEVDGDHLFCLANGIQTHNSLVAAVLIAVNASEFFTQDMEDMLPVATGPRDASVKSKDERVAPERLTQKKSPPKAKAKAKSKKATSKSKKTPTVWRNWTTLLGTIQQQSDMTRDAAVARLEELEAQGVINGLMGVQQILAIVLGLVPEGEACLSADTA